MYTIIIVTIEFYNFFEDITIIIFIISTDSIIIMTIVNKRYVETIFRIMKRINWKY